MKNVSLLILSLVMCLTLAEGVVTLALKPPKSLSTDSNQWMASKLNEGEYEPDPDLGYRPSAKSREGKFPASNRKKSILIFGDSITAFGLLHEPLSAELNDPRYNVHEVGVGGYNTLQEAIYFERFISKAPEILILGFCLNDFLPPFTVVSDKIHPESFAPSYRPVGTYNAFWFDHFALYRFFKLRQIGKRALDIWSEDTPRLNSELVSQGLERFRSYAVDRKIPFLVIIYPHLADYSDVKYYGHRLLPVAHRQILSILTDMKIAYLDVHPLFKGENMNAYRISPLDDVHPNRAAQAKVAKALAPILRPYLN